MAKVRFGTGIAELRGSVGGSVYSRTHAGAVVRNRIVPVNPNTQAQDDIRSLFAQVAADWTNVDAATKQDWEDFAALVSVSNVFGETYTPTGRQMYQQCNMNTAIANSTILNTPGGVSYLFAYTALTGPAMDYYVKPTPPSFVGDDKSFLLSLTAGAVTTFESNANFNTPSATDDIQRLIVRATNIMRPTRQNRKPNFRLLGSYSAAVAGILDVVNEWNTVFGGTGYAINNSAQLEISVVNKGGLRSDPVLVNVETV